MTASLLQELCTTIGTFSETIASLTSTEEQKKEARAKRDATLAEALPLYAPGRRTIEVRQAALYSGAVPLIRALREDAERPLRLTEQCWEQVLRRLLPEELDTLLDEDTLSAAALAFPLFQAICDGVPGFRSIYLSRRLTRHRTDSMLRTEAHLYQDPSAATLQAQYLQCLVHGETDADIKRSTGALLARLSQGDFRGAVMLHLAGAPLDVPPGKPKFPLLQSAFLQDQASNHGKLALRSAVPSLARHLAEPALLETYLAALRRRTQETL